MATFTDTLTMNWSGNGSPFSSQTQAEGSTGEQILTSLATASIGAGYPFPMSHSALEEFVANSTQNVMMCVNAAAPYVFTCSSANATVGATYTNNTQTFTVLSTIAAGTVLLCTGTGAPTGSGTLTKATGTGDSTITFSVVATPIATINLLANQTFPWYNNGYFPNPFSADLVELYFTNTSGGSATINVRAMRT